MYAYFTLALYVFEKIKRSIGRQYWYDKLLVRFIYSLKMWEYPKTQIYIKKKDPINLRKKIKHWNSTNYYLRDDCDLLSQVMKTQFGNVNSINDDFSTSGFHNTEECKGKRGFASTCSAHYSNLKFRKVKFNLVKPRWWLGWIIIALELWFNSCDPSKITPTYSLHLSWVQVALELHKGYCHQAL